MGSKLLFTYNPWKYYDSFKNTIHNVRLYYPESDIVIFFDKSRTDLDRYLQVATLYKCDVIIRENELGYINRAESAQSNSSKQAEWVDRIKYACKEYDGEWVMLLEDDVLIKREIKHWPEADCGTNRDRVGFTGGGSVFRREVFLNALEVIGSDNIKEVIESEHVYSWAGDMLLQRIFSSVNASHQKWIELAEPGYYDNTDHAVFHGYKDLHKLG